MSRNLSQMLASESSFPTSPSKSSFSPSSRTPKRKRDEILPNDSATSSSPMSRKSLVEHFATPVKSIMSSYESSSAAATPQGFNVPVVALAKKTKAAENGAEGDEQFNYDALTQYVNKLRQLNASLHNDINKNAMEKRVLCEKLLEAQEREINLSKQLSQRTNEMAELSEQIDIMILELETTQKKEVQQLQKSVDSLKSELAAQKRHAAASKFQNVTAAAPCLASALEMDAAQKNRLRDATSHTLEVGSAFATMAPSSNSNITISFKQPNSTTSWNGAEFFNRVQSFLESTFVESD